MLGDLLPVFKLNFLCSFCLSLDYIENITVYKRNESKSNICIGKLLDVGCVVVQDSNNIQIKAKSVTFWCDLSNFAGSKCQD